jgi:hypothetical protein
MHPVGTASSSSYHTLNNELDKVNKLMQMQAYSQMMNDNQVKKRKKSKKGAKISKSTKRITPLQVITNTTAGFGSTET